MAVGGLTKIERQSRQRRAAFLILIQNRSVPGPPVPAGNILEFHGMEERWFIDQKSRGFIAAQPAATPR